MSYRFIPLLDAAGQPVVRQVQPGEYALHGCDLLFNASDSVSQGKFPIYVRVPHTDTGTVNTQLLEALKELADLMQGVIDGDYTPDSFTLQPAHNAIKQASTVVSADTACEVAFARMYATFENLWTDKDAPFAIDYTHLCARFRDGERTPALVAEMTDLTNRMKGST